MKCKVCHNEVEQGRAKCPMCGFPMLQMVQGDASEENKMNELAENFRKKKLKLVSVSLKVYTNAMENDRLKVTKEDYIVLAEGLALSGSEIIWYPEKFARLTGDCSLRVVIVNTSGEKKECDTTVANPQIQDFWQVGLLPQEGFQFRIVIGNKKKYASSENISYL